MSDTDERGQMLFVSATVACAIIPGILGGMVLALTLDPPESWLTAWVFGWMFLPMAISAIGVTVEKIRLIVEADNQNTGPHNKG